MVDLILGSPTASASSAVGGVGRAAPPPCTDHGQTVAFRPGSAQTASVGTTAEQGRQAPVRPLGVVIAVLVTIIMVFFARRLATDVPHIVAGTVPDDDLTEKYVAHPWLAYGHIV